MDYFVIPTVSFLSSLLTFYTGFGLGTILAPVFAIWFPLDLAIALTAIVHFLNNIFKFILVGRHTNVAVLIKFGLPAMLSSYFGAQYLAKLSNYGVLFSYHFIGRNFFITAIGLAIAILMIFFILFEILPRLKAIQIDKKYLVVGGILSGFFGGISGHQGALRSAFLIKSDLNKESFIATGISIACLVDIVRISSYSAHFTSDHLLSGRLVTVLATLAAFAGAFFGNRMLNKVKLNHVQQLVAAGLIILAITIGMGLI